MVEIANLSDQDVCCSFNEIELVATADDPPSKIVADYDAESKRRSEEYHARPEVIVQRAEWERKDSEKKANLAAILADAPAMKLRDATAWQRYRDANQDGYGKACVDYAEKWARVMQVKIVEGATVEECAKEASHIADDEGITGFMYGCAVQMLAGCWVFGEQLRRWHNLDTQIGTEGEKANASSGVLNPAILTMATKGEK